MRRFTIDSSVLGTPRHIVGDSEGFVWSDSVPRDSWHLTGDPKGAPSAKCLDTLLRLAKRSLPGVPGKYVEAMSCLVTGSNPAPIPWQHVMPQEDFRLFFKNLVQETQASFSDLPFDYYEAAWSAGSRVLSSLRPAKVDPEVLDRCLEGAGQNAAVLEGFRPKRSGFAHPVTYDRFATRTGRLTVSEGPNILVLKKECRGAIVSSFEGGSVVSLDFRALEPRIVLAEAGRHSEAGDLYEDIAANVLGGKVNRSTVKVAVLAELYGISRASLRTKLGVTDKALDAFIEVIRLHFGIEKLRGRLKEQLTTTGHITNRFGRPLEVPAGQDNLLVNTYAQSSGVDVAMLGFDEVLRTLGEDGIRPLFVLHDALILDVRIDRLAEVMSIASVPIPSYETPFPLKPE